MVTDKDSGSARNSKSRSRSKSPSISRSISPANSDAGPKRSPSKDIVKDESDEPKVRSTDKLERSRSISKSRSRTRSPRRRDTHKRSRRRSRSRTRSPRRSRSRSRGSRRRRDSRDRRSRRSRSYSRNRSPSPQYRRLNPSPCRVIGVFGLSFQTDDRDIKRVFEKYGRVDKVKLVTDPRTGRSRGFAFVYMANVDDAEEAKERVHGSEVDGNHVRCEYSISNREHNPTPGVYMGRRTTRYDDDRRGRYSRSRSRSYERRRRSYSNDRY